MEKSLKINKTKVEERLREMRLQQKELASLIGMDPAALNRALKRGIISSEKMELIGYYLDLAPEYLGDNPSMIDGFPNDYNIHLMQTKETEWITILRAVWLRNGYDSRFLDHDTFFGLLPVLEKAAASYIDSLPPEKLESDSKKQKIIEQKIEEETEYQKAIESYRDGK